MLASIYDTQLIQHQNIEENFTQSSSRGLSLLQFLMQWCFYYQLSIVFEKTDGWRFIMYFPDNDNEIILATQIADSSETFIVDMVSEDLPFKIENNAGLESEYIWGAISRTLWCQCYNAKVLYFSILVNGNSDEMKKSITIGILILGYLVMVRIIK